MSEFAAFFTFLWASFRAYALFNVKIDLAASQQSPEIACKSFNVDKECCIGVQIGYLIAILKRMDKVLLRLIIQTPPLQGVLQRSV